jgi:signal transduction histidine kinase
MPMPKILAIDDKQDNLITITAVLKALIPDCQVITAQSGPEGIEMAKAESPDTILLDIRMPKMDGYEVCERLKNDERTKHIPIIMLTAINNEPKDLVKGLSAGADAYLAKPIDESVLIAQVNTALRIKAAEDQLRNQKEWLEEMVSARTAELTQTNRLLKKEIEEHHRAQKEKSLVEAQLRQAQKMEAVGTLTGGIAHDFNNMLSIIIGNAELALSDIPDWNPTHEFLEEIHLASLRAKDVIRQLLSFSRKTQGQRKVMDISPVIKETMKMLRATIPTSVEFREDVSGNLSSVLADPTQISQVMMNLCTNAAHAMEDEGGVLQVNLEDVEIEEDKALPHPDLDLAHYVKLVVKDTGQGIRTSVLDRIFDPYFTTKDVGKGTGLGLSVVHGIVKGHNGHIWVESTLGKGTAFEIFFPALDEGQDREEKAVEDLPEGSETILFVDDEPSMVELNQRRLERFGYKVIPETDASKALEMFRVNPGQFDLVITDMTMPKMTGDKLAGEMLKIRPNMPIILCTGYSQKMSSHRAREIGIRKYLQKPIEMGPLVRSVREVLDGR